MRHAALALLAAAVIALTAALGFVRAADDCATAPCVYVPLIRAGGGPGNAPDVTVVVATPTTGVATPASTATASMTPRITRTPTNTPVIGVTLTTTPGPSPTTTGTPTATATPTQLPPSFNNCQADPNMNNAPNYPIKIVDISSANETVTLQNISQGTINLASWEMCSITGNQHHPISGSLAAGESKVFTNTGGPIWNNATRDDGALYDPQGHLVSYFVN